MSPAEIFDEATGDIALGEIDAAVDKFRECTRLDPEFFDAWHALGMALMKSGHYPEAIEAGLQSVRLRPNDQLAWSSLSLFYVRINQVPEAEAAGAKARIISWGGKVNPDAIPPAAQ
ncbi:MAG: tetratricopeptide repeat protein [Verrucomicrobiaceae bacterium]|nr:MAG: tetratricopeptide repeat protein [Verrucomicrobiaceae bacterium]